MTATWRDQAACQNTDPELFFPSKANAGVYARARAVCGTCPVTAECLKYAIDHHEMHGMWGGLSTRQRLKLQYGVTNPEVTLLPCCDGSLSLGQYFRELRAGGKPCETCRLAHNARKRWDYARRRKALAA